MYITHFICLSLYFHIYFYARSAVSITFRAHYAHLGKMGGAILSLLGLSNVPSSKPGFDLS